MANINTVAVSGNVTRDPEMRTFESGTEKASFGLAYNRSRKNADGDGYIEETSFFDVEVFGNFAGLVGKKLRKGDAATVLGRLEQQSWETDGQKRSKVVIIAQQIDSPAFFKKVEEVAPLSDGAQASAAATDDDIPF